MRPTPVAAAIAMALALLAPRLGAQSLASRVAAVRNGAVTFHFAARDGVCGDGSRYVRLGRHSFMGNWSEDRGPCAAGPVQVRLQLNGGAVEKIESWVGPRRDRDARDLEAVPAVEAARYLVALAGRGHGRQAAKAILPAVLADSAVVWPELLALAKDASTADAVRREAMTWLSRFAGASLDGDPNDFIRLEDDAPDPAGDVKVHAVFVASQLPKHESVPMLVEIARTNRERRVRRSALFWLGQSGDARAVGVFEALLR